MKTPIAIVLENELSRIADPDLQGAIRSMLVTPYPVERDWSYGSPGEKFACWTVLEHRTSNTGIAYCESGFGPKFPWGLVWLSGDHMDIGSDSGWFQNLEDAMRESRAWDSPNLPK